MKRNLREIKQIFAFTVKQQFRSGGYRKSIIIMSILCFLIPAVVFMAPELTKSGDSGQSSEQPEKVEPSEQPGGDGDLGEDEGGSSGQENEKIDIGSIKKVFYLDGCEKPVTDAVKIAALLKERTGKDIDVKDYKKDFEKADKDSKKSSDTVILLVNQGKNYYLSLVSPDGSKLDEKDIDSLEKILKSYSFALAAEINKKDGDSATEGGAAGADEAGDEEKPASEEEARQQELKEAQDVIVALISYINAMLVYFFALLYGQSVANSVVLEKTSKLMEAFLVSVRPGNIVMGKMLGIALSGVVQLGSWLISLALGFTAGIRGVKLINPDANVKFLDILEGLRLITDGMFSLPNIIIAIVFALLGILLYCALAGIGGSMASRQEDLVTTNIVFSLSIIGSFFLIMFGGSLSGIDEGASFIDWLPFTSIMIMPARTLVGGVSLGKAFASMGIVVAFIIVLAWFAGKVYRAMVFYRGDAAGAFKFMKSAVTKKGSGVKS